MGAGARDGNGAQISGDLAMKECADRAIIPLARGATTIRPHEFWKVEQPLRQLHLELCGVGECEAVILELLSGLRVARDSLEKPIICRVEIAQCLLKAMVWHLLEKRGLHLQVFDLFFLTVPGDRPAGHRLVRSPVIPALFKAQIVEQAAISRDLRKSDLLIRSWIDPDFRGDKSLHAMKILAVMQNCEAKFSALTPP